MDNKYDVFISYSRHDTDVVNAFVDRLEREGFCVWIDRAGIESGDAFKKIILQAIKSSAVVLFFSSQFSNQSGWTAKEIGVAVKYKKPIIPILLDGSNFNEEVEFDLINLDFIDYQDVTVRGIMMDRLVKSLKTKITNPIGQKKAEEARLKAEAAERERLEQERRKKEEAERKAREAAERERLERERKAEETKRKAEQERRERERAEAQHKTELESNSTPYGNPKSKTGLWIGLWTVAVVALVMLLAWPKKDHDTYSRTEVSPEECRDTSAPKRDTMSYLTINADDAQVITITQFKTEFWTLIHNRETILDSYINLYKKYKYNKVDTEEYEYLYLIILKDYASFHDWVNQLKQITPSELKSINTIEELKRKIE